MQPNGAAKPPRGLSMPQNEFEEKFYDFRKEFDSDEKCREAIIDWGSFDTRHCSECGGTDVERDFGSSIVKCQDCRTKFDVFEDTFFQRIRKPLAYLTAFWLKQEHIEISGNRFSKYVGIAQSTGHEVLKKIDTVILDKFLTNATELPSRLFVGIFAKRSSETPARESPRLEEPEVQTEPETEEEEEPDDSAFEFQGMTFDLEGQRKVYRAMSDTPLSSDELFDLTGVEQIGRILNWLRLAKLVQKSGVDMWQRVQKVKGIGQHFTVDEEKLARFFEHVRHVFHGVSRKHLQKFLARYLAFIDDLFVGSNLLIEACARHPYISGKDIRSFVTNEVVQAFLG